jgi:hypothetical protein
MSYACLQETATNAGYYFEEVLHSLKIGLFDGNSYRPLIKYLEILDD